MPDHRISADTAPLIARAEAQSMPCLRMIRTDGGDTYFGGVPELPPDAIWPTWKGVPLSFLAQVDLGAAPKDDWPEWMPRSGRLTFFYDTDSQPWGIEATDIGSWCVLFADSSRALSPRRPPSPAATTGTFRPVPLRAMRARSFPSAERLMSPNEELTDEDYEALASLHERMPQPRHQLFGFPANIQSDSMEQECAQSGFGDTSQPTDWQLLLQIDSDDHAGMMWGDVGMLYFWIRREDAARADFSKVWMILQCY